MNWTLGLDISCDTFDYALLDVAGSLCSTGRLANTPEGYSALMDVFETHQLQHQQVYACLEATGVYSQSIAYFFFAAQIPVSVVNPAQIHAYGKSLLRRAKTDRMDAHLIARFAFQQHPALWVPPGDLLAELRTLTRARDELTTAIVQLRNQQHASQHAFFATTFLEEQRQELLGVLERQQEALEGRIQVLILSDQVAGDMLQRLTSLPGIGFKIATVFMSETALMNFGSSKQLAAFAGLNPQIQESGKYRGHASISKKGNARLRKAAYQAAVCSVRSHSSFGDFYRKLRVKGKPAKLALVALAHKILRTALAVVKHQKNFENGFRYGGLPETIPEL